MPRAVSAVVPSLKDLEEAIRLRREIQRLERRLGALFGQPADLAVNTFGFSADEMRRIGAKLHARAKERSATGKSREFKGSMEELF